MRSTMEVTPEIIDCWRINYGLDKTPHELCAFWNDRVPSGAVMALKVACNEIESLRGLLNRQYRADAALYGMPHDCTEEQYRKATTEHAAVHLLLMAEFEPDSKPEMSLD